MKNAVLIQASLVRIGDRVRFKNPRCDFTVQDINANEAGIRFLFNHNSASNLFGHGEMVWIERRAT